MKKLLTILLGLLLPITAFGATTTAPWLLFNGSGYQPQNSNFQVLFGRVATTTLDRVSIFGGLFTDTLRVSALSGSGTRCVQTDNNGTVAVASAACGSGSGGSGGGTWATTTSQVTGQFINYPLNDTDIVTVGSNSTTSAEVFFDPNLPFAKIFNQFFGLSSTTLQNFTYGYATGTQIRLGDGTVNLPSLAFSSTFDTGIYRPAANTIGFTTNGNLRFSVTTSTFQSSNTSGAMMATGAASASNPTIVPNRGQSNTGIGANTGGNVSIVNSGAETVRFESTGMSVFGSTTLQNFTASNSTSSQATTTNLSLSTLFRSGTTDGCATWAGGILGTTGSACGSGSGGTPYPFPVATNGTTTLTNFFGGLGASASSTIGGGTTGTGLTIFGGATTTGGVLNLGSTTMQVFTSQYGTSTEFESTSDSYFATAGGAVGIGTKTPKLVNVNSKLTVAGTGSVDIIASTTDNTTSSAAILEAYADGGRLVMGSHASTQIVPRYGLTLGGWGEITQFANGTPSNGLVIGTNTVVPLVFGVGNMEIFRAAANGRIAKATTTPQADFHIVASTTNIATLAVQATTSQASPVLDIWSAGQQTLFNVNPNGNTAVGTSSPNNLMAQLLISSTTQPQLALGYGAGVGQWNLRNTGGILDIATSSATSLATSTISALRILPTGQVTIPTLPTGFVVSTNGALTSDTTTYTPTARTITINGTTNQITSSAGAQDLSANRTWTLSVPNLFVAPSNASSTLFSTTYASTSQLCIGGDCRTVWPTAAGNSKWATSTDGQSIHPTGPVQAIVGIGTTTAHNLLGQLQVSTSTKPQLWLGYGAGVPGWAIRNDGAALSFSTSTAAYATTTPTAWRILNTGTPSLGVGTSTLLTNVIIGAYANATATIQADTGTTKGGCLMLKDSDGSGYTYLTVSNGIAYFSTTNCN